MMMMMGACVFFLSFFLATRRNRQKKREGRDQIWLRKETGRPQVSREQKKIIKKERRSRRCSVWGRKEEDLQTEAQRQRQQRGTSFSRRKRRERERDTTHTVCRYRQGVGCVSSFWLESRIKISHFQTESNQGEIREIEPSLFFHVLMKSGSLFLVLWTE